MGSKGQHHRKRRPSKVFNQVGQREKDLADRRFLRLNHGVETQHQPVEKKHVRFQEEKGKRRSERIKQ